MKPQKEGHVVLEMKIGNSTVKFCDDYYRNQTPEEKKQVDIDIANSAWEVVRRMRARGIDI